MRRRRAPDPTTSAARGRPTSLSVSGDLERVFNKFDSNGDDKILFEEFAALLASLCHPHSEEELHRMMVEANSNGQRGRAHLRGGLRGDQCPVGDLRLAFAIAIFDLDRNNIISAEELFRGLSRIDCDDDSLISSRSLKP
ncbi:probable calcium-binding protein CML10 [Zingiber officinale]|uniref:EF-hand domain-containing protein n=1 Tax=Zingiber officinale TaxID=94328 RepID=A0A8J5KYE3_ZINOF|nr:probable calcium-binding protein CML10 [Zingiber officinale]KAG6494269.1 hypothetical protein ZIOFF_049290 [Zingiber officinale]